MSQDWIKLEKKTADKPEVAIIAAALELDPDAVLGKVVRIWAWFDSNTVDGVTNVTVRPLLDRIAGVVGFMAAMEMAGWCLETEDGRLQIPRFDRHMGKSAKNRAVTALRVAKSRAETAASAKCNAESVTNVTHAPLPKALPDRDREGDSSTHTHTAGAGGEEEGERIPQAGFPTRQAVLDYATTKGWPLREATDFWLHFDSARSAGDRSLGPHWHWWSRLEKWINDNAAMGVPTRAKGQGSRGAGKEPPKTINDFDDFDDDDQP